MFSSRKARNKRSFTTVQIVSGQLLSATVNPEQPVDISRILAAANKRCSAYCQRLPKGSATMPALSRNDIQYSIDQIYYPILYRVMVSLSTFFSTTFIFVLQIDIFHNLFSSKNLIKSHFLKQKICFFFAAWFAFSLSIAL